MFYTNREKPGNRDDEFFKKENRNIWRGTNSSWFGEGTFDQLWSISSFFELFDSWWHFYWGRHKAPPLKTLRGCIAWEIQTFMMGYGQEEVKLKLKLNVSYNCGAEAELDYEEYTIRTGL